jgi:hypothetical protein
MTMTKKKSKETMEVEEKKAEAYASSKAAQEPRRQEFKGPFAGKMEELGNNILTAKKGRVAGLRAFMGDVHEFIATTKNGVRELGEETHDFLRSAEHNRIKEFNGFMTGIQARVEELGRETKAMLKCFGAENKERAHEFRAAHNTWLKFSRELSRVR